MTPRRTPAERMGLRFVGDGFVRNVNFLLLSAMTWRDTAGVKRTSPLDILNLWNILQLVEYERA